MDEVDDGAHVSDSLGITMIPEKEAVFSALVLHQLHRPLPPTLPQLLHVPHPRIPQQILLRHYHHHPPASQLAHILRRRPHTSVPRPLIRRTHIHPHLVVLPEVGVTHDHPLHRQAAR
uniref:Uncharacterized protein n=1 Tax=Opuntia streptacantha TaxID=393608 RepID=A0A7C8YG22_OPUST